LKEMATEEAKALHKPNPKRVLQESESKISLSGEHGQEARPPEKKA
jgi:hypothetical protein